jgi:hypothetical protein
MITMQTIDAKDAQAVVGAFMRVMKDAKFDANCQVVLMLETVSRVLNLLVEDEDEGWDMDGAVETFCAALVKVCGVTPPWEETLQ